MRLNRIIPVAAFSLLVSLADASAQLDENEPVLPPQDSVIEGREVQPSEKNRGAFNPVIRPENIRRLDAMELGFAPEPGREIDDGWVRAIDPSNVRVLKDGEPVLSARVLGYLGYPIEVSEDEHGQFHARALWKSESNNAPGYWEATTTGTGDLQMIGKNSGLTEGQPVFVVHPEAGYAMTTLTVRDGKCAIVLQDWCSAMGTVGPFPLRGKVKTPDIGARWESFPFAPGLRRLSPGDRRLGPGLFSLIRRVSLTERQTYMFRQLPEGRIQFSLGYGESDGPIATNISWWASVDSNGGELPTQEVSAIAVMGRIVLSDELLEKVTHVKRGVGGRIEVKHDRLKILITPQGFGPNGSIDTLLNGPTQIRTDDSSLVETSLRQAIVWGRPEGVRETMSQTDGTSQGLFFADVRDDGTFVALLRNGDYSVTQLWSKSDSSDQHQQQGNTSSTAPYRLLTRIDKQDIRARDSETDEIPIIELGEIRVEMLSVEGRIDADGNPVFLAADRGREIGFSTNAPSVDFKLPPKLFDNDLPEPRVVPAPVQDAAPKPSPGQPAADPVDRSIGSLITRILSAGDQKTRENLRKPLQDLLAKKFDAEQAAREALLVELTTRLNEASTKVKERRTQRDKIIGQQVQRMLGLPLDDFQPLPGAEEPQMFDDGRR